MNRWILRSPAILFLLCFIPAVAQNRPMTGAEGEAFRKKVMESTRNTSTIECDFRQEKELSMMSEKLVSSGKFWFRKEKKLRWEYTKPFPYLIIINNDRMTVIDENKENVINMQSNNVFREINRVIIGAVRGTLLDDQKGFRATFSESGNAFLARLVPLIPGLKETLQRIDIYFSKSDYTVDRLVMQEASGDYTRIEFTSKKLNQPLPDEKFIAY